MTTHEVARWFDGLRGWLGDALSKPTVSSLSEISEAFRELPDKPFKQFVKDIKALREGNGSATALIDEVKAYRSGQGGNSQTILARIKKLKSSEAKELASAFALPEKKLLKDRIAVLCNFVASANGREPTADAIPDPISPSAPEIETGTREFRELRDSLANLSIEEIRHRFTAFHRFSAPVLEGIAAQLGYNLRGGKAEICKQLLQMLEGLKISQFRGEIIGRM